MFTHPHYTPLVLAGIAKIEAQSASLLQLSLEIAKADGGKLYHMDLLAMAAAKRHLSTAAATDKPST